MRAATFKATAQSGQLIYESPASVGEWLLKVPRDVQIVVTFKKYTPPRSNNQNRWFHGVVLPMIAEAAGMDVLDMKYTLKLHFLPIWIGQGEHMIQSCRATSSLTTAEFSTFVEDCRRLAAEMFPGLDIPDPRTAAERGLI